MIDQGKEQYRVVLKSIGNNTNDEIEEFCKKITERFNFPPSVIRKMAHRNPIVVKKNLSLKKAEALAIAFKSYGATVAIEKRIPLPVIQIEQQGFPPPQLALESCSLLKTQIGNWFLIGRIKNLSQERLEDIWAMVQVFEEGNELLTYEEIPLPINPLLPNQLSPFKALLEGSLSIQRISLLFKNPRGTSFYALDQRKKREWEEIKILESPPPLVEEQKERYQPLEIKEEILEEPLSLEVQPPIEGIGIEEINSAKSPLQEILPEDKEEVKGEALEDKQREEPLLYPWIEEFKKAIHNYEECQKDGFTHWIGTLKRENLVENPYHFLILLLVYSRFNQKEDVQKALMNTKKVFNLLLKPSLSLDEIPEIEGTPFFPQEVWRNLFFRAFPKIQEVAKEILEKREWKALDLERFIQVIPHMGISNSRWVIRSINKWIPESVRIDFSENPILIGESLYRVASRLGIVNPFFDPYRGKNSMGEIKIQSFAKMVFPEDPSRIEESMDRLGRKGEEGHCFPKEPNCQGCLFEAFCPKLFTEVDPSEKGILK
ncbi:MAG: hypothetical protein ACUVT6_09055 [Thermodesulfobacteriota bacterium]